MQRRLLRVYADTSVFGGVFDAEFARVSRLFFDAVRRRRLSLVTSALVAEELVPAPADVREWFRRFQSLAEMLEVSADALSLRGAYIRAGIVPRASAADALHVALATVGLCPVLVSWNCRHIVHFHRIRQYNAVNTLHGCAELAIHTPMEVIADEEEAL